LSRQFARNWPSMPKAFGMPKAFAEGSAKEREERRARTPAHILPPGASGWQSPGMNKRLAKARCRTDFLLCCAMGGCWEQKLAGGKVRDRVSPQALATDMVAEVLTDVLSGKDPTCWNHCRRCRRKLKEGLPPFLRVPISLQRSTLPGAVELSACSICCVQLPWLYWDRWKSTMLTVFLEEELKRLIFQWKNLEMYLNAMGRNEEEEEENDGDAGCNLDPSETSDGRRVLSWWHPCPHRAMLGEPCPGIGAGHASGHNLQVSAIDGQFAPTGQCLGSIVLALGAPGAGNDSGCNLDFPIDSAAQRWQQCLRRGVQNQQVICQQFR